MTPKLAFFALGAALLALVPESGRLGAIPGSCALVLAAALFAWTASGAMTAIGAGAGAVGAFAAGVLAPTSPAVAGAALVALAFAERSTRVRGPTARAVHAGAALVAGALAGSIATAYAGASLPVRLVALVVGATLIALPLLVEADDPIAHGLDGAADELAGDSEAGDARAALREAAELRRKHDAASVLLPDRDARSRVDATWSSLERLAETRVRVAASRARAATAVAPMLDARLREHVDELTRAYAPDAPT